MFYSAVCGRTIHVQKCKIAAIFPLCYKEAEHLVPPLLLVLTVWHVIVTLVFFFFVICLFVLLKAPARSAFKVQKNRRH